MSGDMSSSPLGTMEASGLLVEPDCEAQTESDIANEIEEDNASEQCQELVLFRIDDMICDGEAADDDSRLEVEYDCLRPNDIGGQLVSCCSLKRDERSERWQTVQSVNGPRVRLSVPSLSAAAASPRPPDEASSTGESRVAADCITDVDLLGRMAGKELKMPKGACWSLINSKCTTVQLRMASKANRAKQADEEAGRELDKEAEKDAEKESEESIVRDILSITGSMFYLINVGAGAGLWVCPVLDCRRMFNRLTALKSHIFNHYNLKPYKCDHEGCSWSFYTLFKLKRHRETHLNKKDFVCPFEDCNKRFTTIYNLNTHQRLHDRPPRLDCAIDSCPKKFQTRRAMEAHLKSHDRAAAPYKCTADGCGKSFFSASSLNAHARAHQYKEWELRCQWIGCGRFFDKPCRLKAHMRTHTGDRPYVCRFKGCTWAFSSASKLKRHQSKHTNERRFRCTIGKCDKAFMRSEHLKEHTLTHIAQRTFQCYVCDTKFSARASLYVHNRKMHPHLAANGTTGRRSRGGGAAGAECAAIAIATSPGAAMVEAAVVVESVVECDGKRDVLQPDDLDGCPQSADDCDSAMQANAFMDDCPSELVLSSMPHVVSRASTDVDRLQEEASNELFSIDESSDFVLLLGPVGSGFPASTVNLKDLD